jgi:hypothetical protein
MTSREQYIEGIKRMPQKVGKNHLLASLDGKKLSMQQAIWAHCFDCQGGYSDGAGDCLSDVCSLRAFMPYNPNRIKQVAKNPGGNPDNLKKWRESQATGNNELEEELEDEELEDVPAETDPWAISEGAGL